MGETIRMTSAEAAKLLRKLNEELDNVLLMERQSRVFSAALGEDVESVRPAYDYGMVQNQIESLEARIRQVKHAVSSFNLAQEVPGFEGMTIDQMLVYIPQLSRRKDKLSLMQQRLHIGISQCFQNAQLFFVGVYVMPDIKKQHNNCGRQQTPPSDTAHHLGSHHQSVIHHSCRSCRDYILHGYQIHIVIEKQSTDQHRAKGGDHDTRQFCPVFNSYHHIRHHPISYAFLVTALE